MKFKLQNPKEITIVEKRTQVLEEITINRVVDFNSMKVVKCFINEFKEPITLWEGEEYDQIGQWTDEDVVNKLNVFFSNLD